VFNSLAPSLALHPHEGASQGVRLGGWKDPREPLELSCDANAPPILVRSYDTDTDIQELPGDDFRIIPKRVNEKTNSRAHVGVTAESF
jgi:hypothetical protein